MILAVGTTNPAKLEGVERAFAKSYPNVRLRLKPVDSSSVSKAQPRGLEEMVEGATARARFALSREGGDFGVGVEAGIFKISGFYFDHQQAAIVDTTGKVSLGHSAGYMLPRDAMDEMFRQGKELEEWAEVVSGTPKVGDKGGIINYLTDGRVTRAELTEQCVITALVPWLHRELYDF